MSAGRTYEQRLAGIASTHGRYRMRAWAALIGGLFAAILITVLTGLWFIAPIAILISLPIALLMLRISKLFRPLAADLRTRGRATPAVLVTARHVGPMIRAWGVGGHRQREQRTQLCIEVRPEGASPYQVVLTTFDAPKPVSIDGRAITVYVDPSDSQRIYPDWRGIDAEF